MATIRDGMKSALMIVDVQVGVVSRSHNRDLILGNINKLIKKARAAKAPILWVQHTDDELPADSDDWQIAGELEKDASDFYFQKSYNSSFEESGLESVLSELKVTKIVLAGPATNWCIRATAYGSLDRGYDLTLISDAHTTESITYKSGKTIKGEDLIEELNTAMMYLRYPGRKNEAIRTDDFAGF